MKALLNLDPEVREATESGIPVVALESAMIAHGFDYPESLEFALELHSIVRDEGAVPAVIAVEEGMVLIGLTSIALEGAVSPVRTALRWTALGLCRMRLGHEVLPLSQGSRAARFVCLINEVAF